MGGAGADSQQRVERTVSEDSGEQRHQSDESPPLDRPLGEDQEHDKGETEGDPEGAVERTDVLFHGGAPWSFPILGSGRRPVFDAGQTASLVFLPNVWYDYQMPTSKQ